MSADDLTVFGSSGDGSTVAGVSMTVVGTVTTGQPAVTVATVRVRNDGLRSARPRLFAVDDWSSAGPVPTEPPQVELRPGRQREVLVSTRRPWLRPLGGQRRGAVSVYADVDGDLVAGPQYAVPPRLSWITVAAGVVVLLAGLGAVVARPAGETGVRYPVVVAPTVTAEPVDPPPEPPPLETSGLPADVVFDVRADGATARTPVLVDRDRIATALPPGGRVVAAAKVPSGWVVKRQTGGARFQVLYVYGREAVDLAPGMADPSFWLDGTGTRVLIDGRGAGGAITVVSLPAGTPEATAPLPTHVRVVTWDGPTVLVSVSDAAGRSRYDRWSTESPYLETPSSFEGDYLGVAGGAVVIHQRDGTLDCIVRVPDLFRPIGPALRCGFGVSVDGDVLRGRWSAVSPGGTYAVVPGPNGSAHFAPLPAMLGGRAGFQPATGLPGPVADITWRDGRTAAILAHGDDAHVWACAALGGACRATAVDAQPGLVPVMLAARVPAAR